MSTEQRANIKFCFKHLPKLIKWWKKFMATIVYPVAAFTSGCERRKRGNCAWIYQKRAEIIAEIHGIGIRNIRSVDLSYFDRKFDVHKGLCQICYAHFKTSRDIIKEAKRNRNFYSPDMAPCDFYLFGKLHLAMKGKRYDDVDAIQKASTAIQTEGWPKKVTW